MSHTSATAVVVPPPVPLASGYPPEATHLQFELRSSHPTVFVDLTTRLTRFVSRSGARQAATIVGVGR
jgi:hypothetical protein